MLQFSCSAFLVNNYIEQISFGFLLPQCCGKCRPRVFVATELWRAVILGFLQVSSCGNGSSRDSCMPQLRGKHSSVGYCMPLNCGKHSSVDEWLPQGCGLRSPVDDACFWLVGLVWLEVFLLPEFFRRQNWQNETMIPNILVGICRGVWNEKYDLPQGEGACAQSSLRVLQASKCLMGNAN